MNSIPLKAPQHHSTSDIPPALTPFPHPLLYHPEKNINLQSVLSCSNHGCCLATHFFVLPSSSLQSSPPASASFCNLPFFVMYNHTSGNLYMANIIMSDAIQGMRYVCIQQNTILRSLVQGDDQRVRPHFVGMYASIPSTGTRDCIAP